MARLGTDKNPVRVRVNEKAHALAIYAMCEDKDWAVVIEVDENKPEDIRELKERINLKTGPNDSCPCGSKRKYKKCCGPNTSSTSFARLRSRLS